MAFKVKVDTR